MQNNNQRHHQHDNNQQQQQDDMDEVAWVALELQKKALHRLLFRMDQDDKKNKNMKTLNSSSLSSEVKQKKGRRQQQEGGNSNFRKSFTIIDSSDEELSSAQLDLSEGGISERVLEENKERSGDESGLNSDEVVVDGNGKLSTWMQLWKFIQKIVKSGKLMKSLGWISISSLATISLIKFLSVFFSFFNHTPSSHVHGMSNNSLMDTRKQSTTIGLIPPPIFQSIDHHDDIPRSVKGRFYLHELSTLQEQFENDGVYGMISTSNSSSSKNHLDEGPLFIPITNIERFQEQRQKTKYSSPAPSDIDQEINKNGLFGQMVQLENFRKSSVFNGD